MNRAEWLAERRKGIGASDVAAILGMSPFKSAWQVYAEKTAGYQQAGNEPMAWGLKLEEAVAAAFEEEAHLPVARPALGVFWHQSLPWMLCTPDRMAAGLPLELKTSRAADGWGPTESDEIPDHYALQVHHQMAVLDAPGGYVAVLIGGSDFRWYRIPRSEAIVSRLVMIEGEFWKRCLRREEPAPDWSDPRAQEIWDALHPPREGAEIDLPETAAIHVRALESCTYQGRVVDEIRTEARRHLAALMGDAGVGRLPDGTEIVRRLVPAKTYTVDRREYVDMRIRQRKEKP